ncbi:MAG: hypothetical protein AAFP18_04330 [Bacteroidota bacterium]
MATTHTLYHTPHGHVVRCSCCDHLEVVFRQTHLRLKPTGLAALVREAATVSTDHWEVGSFGVVRVTPEDALPEVRLLMERADLREWQDLLAGTTAMLDLDGLLADVLGTDPDEAAA